MIITEADVVNRIKSSESAAKVQEKGKDVAKQLGRMQRNFVNEVRQGFDELSKQQKRK